MRIGFGAMKTSVSIAPSPRNHIHGAIAAIARPPSSGTTGSRLKRLRKKPVKASARQKSLSVEAAMAPWMWFLGLAAMLTLVFIAPNPILILIVLLGAFETYRRWQERGTAVEGNAEYYKVAPRHRVAVGVVYVGLVVALALGMDATHVVRTL